MNTGLSGGQRDHHPAGQWPRPGARALVSTGYDLIQQGRYDRAIETFDRAAGLAPQWSLPLANRAVALTHLNRLDEAEAAIAAAMRLNVDDPIAHQANAMMLFRRQRLEAALPAAARAIELDDSPFNRMLRGSILERSERFDEALTDYRAVVTQEPTHAAALRRIGRILVHLGRTEDGILSMQAALRADPDNFIWAEELGDLLVHAGKAEQAQAAFAQALRLLDDLVERSPNLSHQSHGLVAQRAILLSQAGRHDAALSLADAELRRLFDNLRMLAPRCMIRTLQRAEVERGLRDCNQALQHEPGHGHATRARALAHLRLARWGDAVRDFDEIVSWNAENSWAPYGRGLAHLRSGNRVQGERDIAAALRLDFFIYSDFARIGLSRSEGTAPANMRAGN